MMYFENTLLGTTALDSSLRSVRNDRGGSALPGDNATPRLPYCILRKDDELLRR